MPHARRNHHPNKRRLKIAESQVAMVKEHLRFKGELVNRNAPGRDAGKTNLDHTQRRRKRLAK